MTHQETKKQNRLRNSISLKLSIVIALSFLLLIPSLMVRKIITERESRREETTKEITSKWGDEQTVTGPILVVPYKKYSKGKNRVASTERDYFLILPSKLDIKAHLDTDTRHRSIYDVLIYTGEMHISGSFSPDDLKEWPEKFVKIYWDEANIFVGISDTKGISNLVKLKWNQSTLEFSPGAPQTNIISNGIHTNVPFNPKQLNEFSIDLTLNGSSSAYFSPIGNESVIHLTSDWNTPSFDGQFISTQNEITDEGFTAEWVTNELNRPYPQILKATPRLINYQIKSVGVNLLLPVDTYQKSERSVKYSFLFIALTFLVIFFSEILQKKKIHPIQYLIIGLSIVIFYSLLIALAEHMPFNLAFLVASVTIISMIVAYTQALFKNGKATLIVGGVLILLYIYLFTILQISDFALILGNIGLVVILALVMIFSKKIDWYGNQKEIKS